MKEKQMYHTSIEINKIHAVTDRLIAVCCVKQNKTEKKHSIDPGITLACY